jgi:hypothetical protein
LHQDGVMEMLLSLHHLTQLQSLLYQKQKLQQKYEQDMKAIREDMSLQFNQIMSMIQQNPKLAHVKPEALKGKIFE